VTVQEAELSQALATGVVDGLITSSATGADNKLFESLKYYYNVQAWIPKNAVTVSKKAFGALDKSTQEAVLKAAAAASSAAGRSPGKWMPLDRRPQARRHAGRAGSAQLKADLAKVGETVIKEWTDKAGADGQAILDAYKAGQVRRRLHLARPHQASRAGR
jgi:TRAP-type C4-dicarboxylate transport system substrate-binding protein